jgi:RNA recognition motif-containing protein
MNPRPIPLARVSLGQIMWPRSEEERMRQRLNGFVAFVKRSDAARAKEQMNETELNGFVMKIGWGKARGVNRARACPQPFWCWSGSRHLE